MRSYRADEHAMRDAQALAYAADEFHRAVNDRDRSERERFAAVTDPYLEVEGALK